MEPEKIGFIGLGLIGGSIAKTIRRLHPGITLIAYDVDRESLSLAMEEHTIDTAYGELTDDFAGCQYIFLCAPVQNNEDFLEKLSGFAGENCIITDVGTRWPDLKKAAMPTLPLTFWRMSIISSPLLRKQALRLWGSSSSL